jgi:Replication-relaxation
VTALGGSVSRHFRPSEEKAAAWNSPFMQHRLDTIDVLIAAERLTHEYPVTCPRMLTERELKHGAIRVTVPPASSWTSETPRTVAVIPDGWFQLRTDGFEPYSFALELDRGTEDQKVWRQKVAAYAVWAGEKVRQAFETDNVTIAVVCPGDERRRDMLADWTRRELESRDIGALADIFLFTAADAARVSPTQFFFSSLWIQPHSPDALSLLDPPTLDREVAFPVV